MSRAHVNPCPTPQIPPARLEYADIPVSISDEHYTRAQACVRAYWAQATNMTSTDQDEFRMMLKDRAFYVEESAIAAPSNHRICRALKKQPTWARYVFVKALYPDSKHVDDFALKYFQSNAINDFTQDYRNYRPVDKKRKKNGPDLRFPNPNVLSVNSLEQRLTAIEETIAEFRSENRARFSHVNERQTLIIEELEQTRQQLDRYGDDIEMKIVPPVDIVVNKVERLVKAVGEIIGIQLE